MEPKISIKMNMVKEDFNTDKLRRDILQLLEGEFYIEDGQ